MSKKKSAIVTPGRALVVRTGQVHIVCPDCGRTDVYFRSKTQDIVCKKCGRVFPRPVQA